MSSHWLIAFAGGRRRIPRASVPILLTSLASSRQTPQFRGAGLCRALSSPPYLWLPALLAIIVCSVPAYAGAKQALPALTHAKDVLELSADESKEAHPVRLKGVVTDYDLEWGAFFMQDQTGGVRVLLPSERHDLNAGDWIEVEGISRQGNFAPTVLPQRIRILGKAPFPVPVRVPLSQIVTGMRDSQWVEVSGIVRSVVSQRNHVIVEIASGDERIKIHLPRLGEGGIPDWLVDGNIRVQGVCSARFNSNQEFIEAVIFVPDSELLRVDKPAPLKPYDTPPIPLRGILQYRKGESIGHRVHVRGIVEMFRPGISLFITDGGDNLYVETASEEILRPGDRVDVLGFPDLIRKGPALTDSICRRIGSVSPPFVTPVKPTEILNPKHDSGLISIEARLLQLSLATEAQELMLQSGSHIFQAILESSGARGRLTALEQNSVLRVSGVCILFRDNDGSAYGFKLRLRTVDDIELIQRPSWWTARRALLMLVLMTVAVLAVLVWLVSLRRRVRSQTETIRRRLQNEAALEQRCQDLIENASDVICTLDLKGILRSLNKAGERISGYARQEVLGQEISHILALESSGRLADVLSQASLGEDWPASELDIIAKDGHRVPLEVSLRIIKEMGMPAGLEAIARDITDRKRAEKERQAMTEQLRQSQKMEAVGQLAGGIAHDFNNLLTVINGYSDLLLSDLSQDDPKRHDLELIKEAGERASSLTSQLLAFSRKQLLQAKVLDLNDAIIDGSKILRRLIGEDIVLAVFTKASRGLIKADPGQIQQIIINLAINARDAMPKGGRLTIETANIDHDEDYVRKHGEGQAGPYVMLAISDNGVGMDAKTQARIFEPFFTTKGLGKGTGLGLSTVYGIIKQSGGFIWVYSEPAKGTTFKIYFPAVEPAADKAAGSDGKEPRLQGVETILVAEDESSVRNLVTRGLRKQGYIVLEASSGKEALNTAREFAGKIDLL